MATSVIYVIQKRDKKRKILFGRLKPCTVPHFIVCVCVYKRDFEYKKTIFIILLFNDLK